MPTAQPMVARPSRGLYWENGRLTHREHKTLDKQHAPAVISHNGDIYRLEGTTHNMSIETPQEREELLRKIRRQMLGSLKREYNEIEGLIDNNQMLSHSGEVIEATTSGINQQYAQMLSLINDIDRVEAELKSWTPKPPENLPAITDQDPPSPQWLVENWIPQNELTILSGEGGVGKSHLLLQLACALACGAPDHYLRDKPLSDSDEGTDPQKTMLATAEDSHYSVQRRIIRILAIYGDKNGSEGWAKRNAIRDNVIYRDMKPHTPIWIPATESGHISNRGYMSNKGHDLLHACEQKEVKFLILDSIAAFYGQDMISIAHVRPFMNYLSAWCNDKEITCVLIGHPPKYRGEGVAGTADWRNAVRNMIELLEVEQTKTENGKERPTGAKYYALAQTKVNDAAETPNQFLKKHTNGILEAVPDEARAIEAYQDYKAYWAQRNTQSQENTDDDELIDLIAKGG